MGETKTETDREKERQRKRHRESSVLEIKVEGVIHSGKSAESDMEVVLSDINENSFQGICEYVHVLQVVMGLLRCDCRELKANRKKRIRDSEFNNNFKKFC